MRMSSQIAKFVLGFMLAIWGSTIAFSQQTVPAQQSTEATATTQAPAASPYYVLGPQDAIEVDLIGPSGFKMTQPIKPDGTIDLPPLLRNVPAGGRTTIELRDQISNALETGGLVLHPLVTVTLVSPVRAVIVLGTVANPSLIPIDRPYHLSEILARVGGIREGGADYVILRPEKGEQRRLSIQALATGDASQDPYVSPGDKIYSPKAEIFYISGQIKIPGAYPLTADMTLRMALARGGGMTDTGSESRIKITRRNVDLARVDLNTKVEPDDVIVVGESFF